MLSKLIYFEKIVLVIVDTLVVNVIKMLKKYIGIKILFHFSSLFVSTSFLATDEPCDELYYYCESLGYCLDEFGSTPCNGTCGTFDYYVYCPNYDLCLDPETIWLCNDECREKPPLGGKHESCNGECGWPWFLYCEEEDMCLGAGIPCGGICYEEETVLCDQQYCNVFDDVNDFKFDCYDRTDETIVKEEWEVTSEKITKFMQLTEMQDYEGDVLG